MLIQMFKVTGIYSVDKNDVVLIAKMELSSQSHKTDRHIQLFDIE